MRIRRHTDFRGPPMSALLKEKDRPETRAAFLGVERSAKEQAWFERLGPGDQNRATLISQRHGLPDILGRILAARGAQVDDVPDLMDPRLRAFMPDPSTLKDMDAAAERLADALQNGEPIAVLGDYDVDGGSSAALLRRFAAAHGRDIEIYIPDRMTEGYGPNPRAIGQLIDNGAKLIVTVDCGTTSTEALAVGAERGIDVIVIDHHQADEALPEVLAVVNPNRQDDISGLGHLCAAGVVFLVLAATTRALRARGFYSKGQAEPALLEMLDIVALATVCDVVPLTGLNRAFVTQGLQVMRLRHNVGLRALADVSGLNSPANTYHLGFLLGPRINAGGRIGDCGLGAKLLSATDPDEARRLAELLDRLNRERKAMEGEILEAAMASADQMVEADPACPILVTGSDEWHKGLVGLVASRLTDRFRRPSLVLSWTKSGSGGPREGTGSLRSIAGVDIGAAVRDAASEGILVKGGGHAMAAGLTITEDKLPEFEAFVRERLQATVHSAQASNGLELDGAVMPAALTEDFVNLLEKAGPYGTGHPSPRFAFPSHTVKFAKVVGDSHVRCSIQASDGSRMDAIAFRATQSPIGDMLLNSDGRPLHIAGQVKRDTWQGRTKTDVIIDDVADPLKQPGRGAR